MLFTGEENDVAVSESLFTRRERGPATMAPMPDDWITTAEAADLIGFHPKSLPLLLREGKIKGRRFGKSWQVSRRSALAYKRQFEKNPTGRGYSKDNQ
jgi:hypothetical protein